jgi:hypothetical protein
MGEDKPDIMELLSLLRDYSDDPNTIAGSAAAEITRLRAEVAELRAAQIETEQDIVQALLATKGAFPDTIAAVTTEYLNIRKGKTERWPRPLPPAPTEGT